MTAFNIIKSITKRGNTVIGAGCYAAAITSSDPNRIIKIGNSSNDPWLDYYHAVIVKNQGNPCVPRVYSFYHDAANSYYVCVMEKLEEFHTVDNSRELSDLCRDFTSYLVTEEDFVAEITTKYSKQVPDIDALITVLKAIQKDTDSMGSAAVEASSWTNSWSVDDDNYDGRRLDMHAANFMYRAGVLVVTDPWCECNMDDIQDMSHWLDDARIPY